MQLKKMNNPEEIKKINKHIFDFCKKEIINHTCQFFIKGKNGLTPFGSGVFTKSEKKYFIITASHVSEDLKNETLFIKIDKENYVEVLGQVWLTDIEKSENIDISIIRLEDKIIPELTNKFNFLSISKFRRHNNLLEFSNYAVVGYPANNIKYEKGLLETGGTVYLTAPCKEKIYDYYKFSPKQFYMLKMEGKGTELSTGKKSKINIQFEGISGCGLWLILPYKNGDKYEIDYRLIGIMTEYRKGKYFCLIGNKIQLIINAFIKLEKIKIREIKLE